MASIKKSQSEAMALIDVAKVLIEKVLNVVTIMEDMPFNSQNFATTPIGFLLQLIIRTDTTKEKLRKWVTNFMLGVVPTMEIAVKAALLTNLKNMVSCSIDPRIPEQYRKRHKDPGDINTPNEYGIDIDIESIDYLDKMSVSPLSSYGRCWYFGQQGVKDVYKFARADDFDAFLWFVIHKGKFPSATDVNINDFKIIDNSYTVVTKSPTLFKALDVTSLPNNPSRILPGNTFKYVNSSNPSTVPNIISMCISADRNEDEKIVHNTLVPVSDDSTSVNWYIRSKDSLTQNIFGSEEMTQYKDGKTEFVGYRGKKTRDYSKERAICNLQYIDPAYGDQQIMGLVNNKVRFTILPKPYIHIPDIAHGEPPWRFKRLLFDAEGNPSQAGGYTLADVKEEYYEESSGKIIIQYGSDETNDSLILDPKSGDVTIKNKSSLITHLVECYPGLTVYEFNYDYVMGMKLFDAKVLASTLLQSIVNTNIGIGATLYHKQDEGTERIKQIIRNIVNSDGTEDNECYFTFDNSKYDAMIEAAKLKRAKRQAFGRVTRDAGVFDSVYDIIKEYDNPTNTVVEKQEILGRAIDQASVVLSEGSEPEDKYGVEFNFVLDLIDNLILAMMQSVLSPKVMMLLEVNQRIMGGTWKEFKLEDVLKSMTDVINSIVKELRDLLIQELLKFLKTELGAIREMFTSLIFREKLEEYASIIEQTIKDCPIMWFKFGDEELDTKLDTVDYADIVVGDTRAGEQPNNKC